MKLSKYVAPPYLRTTQGPLQQTARVRDRQEGPRDQVNDGIEGNHGGATLAEVTGDEVKKDIGPVVLKPRVASDLSLWSAIR